MSAAAVPSPEQADLCTYLETVVGYRSGYLALAFGHDPYRDGKGKYVFPEGGFTQSFYAWPGEGTQFLVDVNAALTRGATDVLVCPALRTTPQRRKGNAAPLRTLWVDLDGPPADPVLWEKLEPFTVASGTEGHQHGYVLLTEEITPKQHAVLNKALRDRLKGDHKWSDDTLLRLPGTYNHKPTVPADGAELGEPALVRVVSEWSGKRWTPDELAELLECDDTAEDAHHPTGPTELPDAEPVDLTELPEAVEKCLADLSPVNKDGEPDRSDGAIRLERACHSANYTRDETLTILSHYPPAVEKYGAGAGLAGDVDRAYKLFGPTRAEELGISPEEIPKWRDFQREQRENDAAMREALEERDARKAEVAAALAAQGEESGESSATGQSANGKDENAVALARLKAAIAAQVQGASYVDRHVFSLNDEPGPHQPTAAARRYLAVHHRFALPAVFKVDPRVADLTTLHHWRGQFWAWDGRRYKELSDDKIFSRLRALFAGAAYKVRVKDTEEWEVKYWQPNIRNLTEVFRALKDVTHLSDSVDPGEWLDPVTDSEALLYDPPGIVPRRIRPARPELDRANLIACRNGLLDMTSRDLYPHTPLLFNTAFVPFDWDPDAPKPTRWLQFLNDIWPDHPSDIACLQQWFGYVLSGRTDLQKIAVLDGAPGSGKGTIMRVLEQLVGEENYTAISLAMLGERFGAALLLGKSLAVLADSENVDGKAQASGSVPSRALERLKRISGEDAVEVDIKNRPARSVRLDCRFSVLANGLPQFNDPSRAINRRLLHLHLTRTWQGADDENSRLFSELCTELSGILRWALDGLAMLIAQGRFTEPTSSLESREIMADLTSPLSKFLREECVVDTSKDTKAQVGKTELANAWWSWAEAHKHKQFSSLEVFAKNLLAAVPGLKTFRPGSGSDPDSGPRPRCWVGVALKPLGERESSAGMPTTKAYVPSVANSLCEHSWPLPTPCPLCPVPVKGS